MSSLFHRISFNVPSLLKDGSWVGDGREVRSHNIRLHGYVWRITVRKSQTPRIDDLGVPPEDVVFERDTWIDVVIEWEIGCTYSKDIVVRCGPESENNHHLNPYDTEWETSFGGTKHQFDGLFSRDGSLDVEASIRLKVWYPGKFPRNPLAASIYGTEGDLTFDVVGKTFRDTYQAHSWVVSRYPRLHQFMSREPRRLLVEDASRVDFEDLLRFVYFVRHPPFLTEESTKNILIMADEYCVGDLMVLAEANLLDRFLHEDSREDLKDTAVMCDCALLLENLGKPQYDGSWKPYDSRQTWHDHWSDYHMWLPVGDRDPHYDSVIVVLKEIGVCPSHYERPPIDSESTRSEVQLSIQKEILDWFVTQVFWKAERTVSFTPTVPVLCFLFLRLDTLKMWLREHGYLVTEVGIDPFGALCARQPVSHLVLEWIVNQLDVVSLLKCLQSANKCLRGNKAELVEAVLRHVV